VADFRGDIIGRRGEILSAQKTLIHKKAKENFGGGGGNQKKRAGDAKDFGGKASN